MTQPYESIYWEREKKTNNNNMAQTHGLEAFKLRERQQNISTNANVCIRVSSLQTTTSTCFQVREK